ncbi:MAG TPA: hypoxanthine phosphoribosyltransferase [Cytophagaceae bacterium]|jgi:hypoxanthine phosphoribosyltransferase
MLLVDREFDIFISSDKIQKRVAELASEIAREYREKDPLFIVILNGAFIFAADLIKAIEFPCQVSFVKVSSYQGVENSGSIKTLFGLSDNLENRNLIIIDDIVDTGNTMDFMVNTLRPSKPASIECVSLLLKPDAYNNKYELKYIGFTIPNDFVVGYGLDYNGYGRNLKDLYHIKN